MFAREIRPVTPEPAAAAPPPEGRPRAGRDGTAPAGPAAPRSAAARFAGRAPRHKDSAVQTDTPAEHQAATALPRPAPPGHGGGWDRHSGSPPSAVRHRGEAG